DVQAVKDLVLIDGDSNANLFVEWFNEQLYDMSAGNHNAYTNLAIKGGESKKFLFGRFGGDTITLSITVDVDWADDFPGISPLQARNAVRTHARAFLDSSQYPDSGTHDEKLRAINKYICETFQYDYRLFSTIPGDTDDVIYSAYQMISDSGAIGDYPRGVCQAYAMYGYIMLKEAGYESITVSGSAVNPAGPHAWNMVEVESKWYHIDFTSNDPIRSDNPPPYVKRQAGAGTVSYNYYMRSDNEIDVNHEWPVSQDGYVYPKANVAWAGNEEIEDITQPVPTAVPTTQPTPTVIPSPLPTAPPFSSAVTQSSMSSGSATASNDVSQINVSDVSDDPEISGDTSQSIGQTASPASSIPVSGNSEEYLFSSENEVSGSQAQDIKGESTVTIYGRLLDGTGEPISGVKLNLYALNRTAITDKNGNFRFSDVKVGSYKIQILGDDGEWTAELPVVISFGTRTEEVSGGITVSGGNLDMELVLDNDKLSIKNVSSPAKTTTIYRIIIPAAVLIIIAGLVIVILKKRTNYEPDID
ncbi:MAG: carboxypeptidase regulatory-like domain-containing protein, partial [Saccharofermentanales bacterium]